MVRDNSDSVEARPSATVVLLREGESRPEILMVRRKAGDAFGRVTRFRAACSTMTSPPRAPFAGE
ncbi:MAG: hypothetical protein ACE5OQ_00475 [Woeseia sp.]